MDPHIIVIPTDIAGENFSWSMLTKIKMVLKKINYCPGVFRWMVEKEERERRWKVIADQRLLKIFLRGR